MVRVEAQSVRRGADSGGDEAFPEEEDINKLRTKVRNNLPDYCSAKETNSRAMNHKIV